MCSHLDDRVPGGQQRQRRRRRRLRRGVDVGPQQPHERAHPARRTEREPRARVTREVAHRIGHVHHRDLRVWGARRLQTL